MHQRKSAQKMRRVKAKAYIENNRLFVVIAILVLIALGCGVLNCQHPAEETTVAESVSETDAESQQDKPQWRFYWSDLAVLVVGSSICTVMIIKERAKAREKL